MRAYQFAILAAIYGCLWLITRYHIQNWLESMFVVATSKFVAGLTIDVLTAIIGLLVTLIVCDTIEHLGS